MYLFFTVLFILWNTQVYSSTPLELEAENVRASARADVCFTYESVTTEEIDKDVGKSKKVTKTECGSGCGAKAEIEGTAKAKVKNSGTGS